MLKPGELHREAFLEVTHHPPRDLAEGDEAADLRPLRCGDTGALQRKVDDADADIGAVRHDQAGRDHLRHFRIVDDGAAIDDGNFDVCHGEAPCGTEEVNVD